MRVKTGRAPALSPEQRRAALIEVTLPLLREHGRAVTTSQIAEAAGVAEGTIFRVFATKDDLIAAAIGAAIDPAPLVAAVRAIDPTLPLRPRLYAVAVLLERRFRDVSALLVPLRATHTGAHDHRAFIEEFRAQFADALEELIGPDAATLRVDVPTFANYLRLLATVGHHDFAHGGAALGATEIVDLLLDGTLKDN